MWSVYPFKGADPEEAEETGGRITTVSLDDRNTFIEGQTRRFQWPRVLGALNLVIAQAGLLFALWRLIRRQNISVVRVGDPYYLGIFGYVLARLTRIPLVIRINGNYDAIFEKTGRPAYPRLLRSRNLEKKIERFILARADLVAGANKNNLDYALENGAKADRATIFRYGNLIAREHFSDPGGRSGLRKEIGVGEAPMLLYVGRLEMVKHVDDLVKVLGMVPPHWGGHLVMVGDGSERAELVRLAEELEVSERLHLVGGRDQNWIASAMADADVILAPHMGRALVEAGLSGTVIVAYDLEWHSELLHHGTTGWLVPYPDTEAFALTVEKCLSDPAKSRVIGMQCRSHVLDMMDPERLREHERSAYARLLGIVDSGEVR